jgi:acyl carrier protein
MSRALPESAHRFRETPLSEIRGFLMQNKVELTPEAAVRAVMRDILGLSEVQVAEFTAETELFGALPELDSMAVAGLLTELEDRLDIMIDDDEVDGELFETFGNLVAFAEMKVTG